MFDFPNSDLLCHLIEQGAVVGTKIETEGEGASWETIQIIQNLSSNFRLPMALKIGGCDARTDLTRASNLRIDEVTAPMIESSFAVYKFSKALNSLQPTSHQPIPRILVESLTGYKNIEEIVSESAKFVKGVNIGRSDLSSSISFHTSVEQTQDSAIVKNHVKSIATVAKEHDLETTLGGKITEKSIVDLNLFFGKSCLIDRVETRRFVLNWEILRNNPRLLSQILYCELGLAKMLSQKSIVETSKWSQYIGELQLRLSDEEVKTIYP